MRGADSQPERPLGSRTYKLIELVGVSMKATPRPPRMRLRVPVKHCVVWDGLSH
jgi:hypothetical protein